MVLREDFPAAVGAALLGMILCTSLNPLSEARSHCGDSRQCRRRHRNPNAHVVARGH